MTCPWVNYGKILHDLHLDLIMEVFYRICNDIPVVRGALKRKSLHNRKALSACMVRFVLS